MGRGFEGGMPSEREIRRIQAEAAQSVEKGRAARQAKKDALAELRRQPIEHTRRSPDDLDRRPVFGNYYTGDDRFDRLARQQNERRPRPQQFGDVYPSEKIDRDLARVEAFKKTPEYREERGPEAIASEYVVNELFSRGQLGRDIRAIPAADPDDYFNHVDTVLAFDEEGGGAQYLGVDITTQRDVTVHTRKLYQTLDGLRDNALNTVEYHHDPLHPETKGAITVPRVVIDINQDRVKELRTGLAERPGFKVPPEMHHEMVEEIILQLSQNAAYLLREHFRAGHPFELPGNDPEGVMEFFNAHGAAIKRQNSQLYDNVMKHVKILGRFLLEEKKAGPAIREINGGPLWKLVHDGRIY